ncbi:recombinase family protein [Porticoccaceae bacterium]|nr:recombinase family protein [Porticoccaceae bacterium]
MSKPKDILHIYTRVSTDQQMNGGTSLDSQLQFGQQKAKSLAMDFEHHDERSASSSKDHLDNRPVIRELLARISEGEIKHIYIYSLDRLSRNTTTSTFIRETLRKNGCTLYTNTNETNLESHEQNLLFGIISEISQYENMLRKERLNLGKRVKARQGYWMGGPPPFGYKKSKINKLILDKEQSEWVERIFRWYSQGLSPKRIKHKLDGNVLTNRGKPIWSYGSVEAILKNSHPNGSYVYYEKEIECPRIVDQEIWDKVQIRRSKKKSIYGNNRKNHDYPLRELMTCGHCDDVLWGSSKIYSEDNTLLSYRCSSQNKNWKKSSRDGDWSRDNNCQNNVSMDCERTIEGIWVTLVNILRLSNQEREISKKTLLKQKNKSHKSKETEIKNLTSKIDKTKETISLIEERIVEKEVQKISSREKAKAIQSFIDKLELELHKLSLELINYENELLILEDGSLWIDWVNDYQDNIDRLERLKGEDRVKEIKKYVKKIDVFFNPETRKHRLDLKLRLPIVKDNLKWYKESNKSKGYSVVQGTNQTMVELDNHVRNIRNTG